MSGAAVRVQGLGKRYRIGEARPFGALRDAVAAATGWAGRWREGGDAPGAAPDGRHIWALRDVSFEVAPGDIVGVIGPNGAGKSTLLKVLSRITPPTEGRVEIAGRVGALLEVGTGFHPELTGRENVYLNGAVLGMSRAEVARKFDEIVAFAGVERFIDTPVKRYSTGMHMRLAFAVAAHLETEVLIVDEVLAVGDAAFQLKCLTKMSEVSSGGRTVLFVSHNLETVRRLCRRAILLEQGRIVHEASAEECVDRYTQDAARVPPGGAWVSLERHPGRRKEFHGPVRLTGLRVLDGDGRPSWRVRSGGPMRLLIRYRAEAAVPSSVRFSVIFSNARHHRLAACRSHDARALPVRASGSGTVVCTIPRLPLVPGRYHLTLICAAEAGYLDVVYDAAAVEVAGAGFYATGSAPSPDEGEVLFDHEWEVEDARHESGVALLGA